MLKFSHWNLEGSDRVDVPAEAEVHETGGHYFTMLR